MESISDKYIITKEVGTMSTPKEKNSVWSFLLLLPIAASILATTGGIMAVVSIICIIVWFLFLKGSQHAFNSGDGANWFQYVPLISKQNGNSTSSQSIATVSPQVPPVQPQPPIQPQPPVRPQHQTEPIQPAQFTQPIQAQTVVQNRIWDESAPAFNKQRLTATIASLKWSSGDVSTLAQEAGDNLQYGLAFRCRYGNIMPHSDRIESIQMSEIASVLKNKLPQGAVCRAWPLYELSKGINMDGLLVVPDQNTPLGLYMIIAGDNTKSRFTVFSMFVPVCTGKAEWISRIYQPSMESLRNEDQLIDLILNTSEQIIS